MLSCVQNETKGNYEIMAELKSGRVFGKYLAHLWVVEFQERGYPHAHLLYTFLNAGPDQLNDINKWVWARIPDASFANGLLREIFWSTWYTNYAVLTTSTLPVRNWQRHEP